METINLAPGKQLVDRNQEPPRGYAMGSVSEEEENPWVVPEIIDPYYDLSKVSERFRALEDGRSLFYKTAFGHNVYVGNDNIDVYSDQLINNKLEWSLVPLAPKTRTVTTKLWVYKPGNGNHEICVYRRSESADPFNWETCLGAIEGSELQEEVEV